jgi:sporulation protein YlmC with PRC-barrel domain
MSSEEVHLNTCLNIESTSTEKVQVIKTSNQQLGFGCTNSNSEIQYEKIRKVGSSTSQQFYNNGL